MKDILLHRKRWSKKFGQLILFSVVGGIGILINTAILYILTSTFNVYYIFASAIATEVAIIANFIGNNTFTFANNKNNIPLWKKFVSFQVVSLLSLVITVSVLWALTSLLGQDLLLVWNIIAILVAFGSNFILNSKYTWSEKKPIPQG